MMVTELALDHSGQITALSQSKSRLLESRIHDALFKPVQLTALACRESTSADLDLASAAKSAPPLSWVSSSSTSFPATGSSPLALIRICATLTSFCSLVLIQMLVVVGLRILISHLDPDRPAPRRIQFNVTDIDTILAHELALMCLVVSIQLIVRDRDRLLEVGNRQRIDGDITRLLQQTVNHIDFTRQNKLRIGQTANPSIS